MGLNWGFGPLLPEGVGRGLECLFQPQPPVGGQLEHTPSWNQLEPVGRAVGTGLKMALPGAVPTLPR